MPAWCLSICLELSPEVVGAPFHPNLSSGNVFDSTFPLCAPAGSDMWQRFVLLPMSVL